MPSSTRRMRSSSRSTSRSSSSSGSNTNSSATSRYSKDYRISKIGRLLFSKSLNKNKTHSVYNYETLERIPIANVKNPAIIMKGDRPVSWVDVGMLRKYQKKMGRKYIRTIYNRGDRIMEVDRNDIFRAMARELGI